MPFLPLNKKNTEQESSVFFLTSKTANNYTHIFQSTDEKSAEVLELFADVIATPAQQ